MLPRRRIVVTGAAGWTARAILEALACHGHYVIGLDLPTADRPPNVDAWVPSSIGDLATTGRAARSADALIHLAVAVGENDYQQPTVPFSTNVLGTYNVLETARREQVPRVVLISSAAVHLPVAADHPLTTRQWRSSPDGDHLYDLTKRLQEEIARDFCQTFGMTTIVLRAGHLVDSHTSTDPKGSPLAELRYARGGWLCRYDLADACLQALSFEGAGYQAFHVIGAAATRQRFDIDRTQRELGFHPRATFDQHK